MSLVTITQAESEKYRLAHQLFAPKRSKFGAKLNQIWCEIEWVFVREIWCKIEYLPNCIDIWCKIVL